MRVELPGFPLRAIRLRTVADRTAEQEVHLDEALEHMDSLVRDVEELANIIRTESRPKNQAQQAGAAARYGCPAQGSYLR